MEPLDDRGLKNAFKWIVLISLAAFGFLVWIIYLREQPSSYSNNVSYLPAVNSILNALSATFLVAGVIAIKRKAKDIHKKCMISAFVFSTLFLVSYIIYHTYHGDTPFTAHGWIRPVYFFILISHIFLTIVGLPLILTSFYLALTDRIQIHKVVARITYPIWLYISVTGVLIYIMLRIFS